MYLRCVVTELWILFYIYILLLITKYVYKCCNIKNIKKLHSNVALVK